MPDVMTARVSGSDAAKWKYVNTTWPLRMHGHSDSIGSLTLTTISALAHTSAAVGTSVAPTARYASSGKPDPAPAPSSTSTVCPSPRSDSAPAGTSATRFSAVLISLGTPTIMRAPRRCVASLVFSEPNDRLPLRREELRGHARHFVHGETRDLREHLVEALVGLAMDR